MAKMNWGTVLANFGQGYLQGQDKRRQRTAEDEDREQKRDYTDAQIANMLADNARQTQADADRVLLAQEAQRQKGLAPFNESRGELDSPSAIALMHALSQAYPQGNYTGPQAFGVWDKLASPTQIPAQFVNRTTPLQSPTMVNAPAMSQPQGQSPFAVGGQSQPAMLDFAKLLAERAPQPPATAGAPAQYPAGSPAPTALSADWATKDYVPAKTIPGVQMITRQEALAQDKRRQDALLKAQSDLAKLEVDIGTGLVPDVAVARVERVRAYLKNAGVDESLWPDPADYANLQAGAKLTLAQLKQMDQERQQVWKNAVTTGNALWNAEFKNRDQQLRAATQGLDLQSLGIPDLPDPGGYTGDPNAYIEAVNRIIGVAPTSVTLPGVGNTPAANVSVSPVRGGLPSVGFDMPSGNPPNMQPNSFASVAAVARAKQAMRQAKDAASLARTKQLSKKDATGKSPWADLTQTDKGLVLRHASKAQFLADPEGTMRKIADVGKDLTKTYFAKKEYAINLHDDLGWSMDYLQHYEPSVAKRRTDWYVKQGWAKPDTDGRIHPTNDKFAAKIKADIKTYEARAKQTRTGNGFKTAGPRNEIRLLAKTHPKESRDQLKRRLAPKHPEWEEAAVDAELDALGVK